ncbi:sulfotransferase [Cyanobium sp. BSA11S]|uniref:sulfotransferase family protein n=1 Tax=Cyanobium sp. BSA11S TaxID=3108224 RepID=UPI003D8168EE
METTSQGSDSKKPNLLIIGAQKSGTTWLHKALDKSRYLSGSTPKELHYFNRRVMSPISAYIENFKQLSDSAQYLYESTPNYFCMPGPADHENIDVAARIRHALGDIPLILMLRNPVDRYQSAYVHHMGKGRVPRVDTITQMHSTFGMLKLGRYASILKHYRSYFSHIHIHLYDELKANDYALLGAILSELGIENDVEEKELEFTANTSSNHMKRLGLGSSPPPKLCASLRGRLLEYYYQEVVDLQLITGIDLSKWLSDSPNQASSQAND